MNGGRRIKTFGAGLLAGLAAAILMTLLMLLLRYSLGIATTFELIGDRAAAAMSVDTFLSLLGRVGGYNQLKQLGVISVIAGQLIAGSIAGLLYAIVVERVRARSFERSARFGIPRVGVLLIASLVVLLWVISLALLWPTLGTHYRGVPPDKAALITAFCLLVSYALCGVALVATYRFMASRAPLNQESPLGKPVGRRVILVGGVGLVFAFASGWLLKRFYQIATFSYDGTQYLGADVQAITPNDRFYVVTKNVVDPRAVKSVWRFEVTGLVDQPRTYTFEDLASMPVTTQATTLTCISNWVGGGLMSNAVWKGVPLRSLLEAAGPKPGVVEVLLHGADGYTDTFAFEKAMDPTTLVAYEMNGEPLPDRHGFPVRIIVPGLYGEKNVKWVNRIELVDHDAKGFYEQQGWGPNFVVTTRSRFDGPDFNQPIKSGVPVVLKGVAFGGDRGIARVEVSFDDARTWQDARLDYSSSNLEWVLWNYIWRPAQPGEYKLAVRATDGAGHVQTSEERGAAPEGSTGYHKITARVEA
jgi:DMSO/TMAO reductase YedYZ molybdopterin-dependent catalytic subunit